MIDRRSLLKAGLFLPMAPLIVKASSLMKVSALKPDYWVVLHGVDEDGLFAKRIPHYGDTDIVFGAFGSTVITGFVIDGSSAWLLDKTAEIIPAPNVLNAGDTLTLKMPRLIFT